MSKLSSTNRNQTSRLYRPTPKERYMNDISECDSSSRQRQQRVDDSVSISSEAFRSQEEERGSGLGGFFRNIGDWATGADDGRAQAQESREADLRSQGDRMNSALTFACYTDARRESGGHLNVSPSQAIEDLRQLQTRAVDQATQRP